MNNEEKLDLSMKTVILDTWKSKLSYPFNHQDLNELEKIIDYYEEHISYYKNQLESSEKAISKCLNKLKTLGKFDGKKFTRSFTLWSADFNELAKMLDIDKGE